ncbi:hypothetical protein OF83DRAFT_1089546 [Amylostereum chailletii]|nr:hypothetical protein OF83DRAFT_1089546 [Amylostereum chailletii]
MRKDIPDIKFNSPWRRSFGLSTVGSSMTNDADSTLSTQRNVGGGSVDDTVEIVLAKDHSCAENGSVGAPTQQILGVDEAEGDVDKFKNNGIPVFVADSNIFLMIKACIALHGRRTARSTCRRRRWILPFLVLSASLRERGKYYNAKVCVVLFDSPPPFIVGWTAGRPQVLILFETVPCSGLKRLLRVMQFALLSWPIVLHVSLRLLSAIDGSIPLSTRLRRGMLSTGEEAQVSERWGVDSRRRMFPGGERKWPRGLLALSTRNASSRSRGPLEFRLIDA